MRWDGEEEADGDGDGDGDDDGTSYLRWLVDSSHPLGHS
jgi:hypothetical protein